MNSERIIYTWETMQRTGLSRQTLWRYINTNKFPKPTQIGNRNAWLESSISNWISETMGVKK